MGSTAARLLLAPAVAALWAGPALAGNEPNIDTIGTNPCAITSGTTSVTCSVTEIDQSVVVNVNNGQEYNSSSNATSVTATISGSGSFTTSDYYNAFYFASWGQQPNNTYNFAGYTNG